MRSSATSSATSTASRVILRSPRISSFWAAYLDEGDDGPTDERLEAALDAFDLAALADIPAGYLSAGQKRRLALARLGVAQRPVWLLDEPTVSLDTASVALLVKAIAQHVAGGGLAVIATHVPMALERVREIRLGIAAAAETPR